MTINIQADYSLKRHNTLGFDQVAEYYCAPADDAALEAALRHAEENTLAVTILGGGSNIVLTKDIKGLVIHPAYTSINIEPTEREDTTLVRAGAGIDWDELVSHTLAAGLRGLENLTLIPGNVGAAPVQNIGAYGVEIEQRIAWLRALHLPSMQWMRFTPEQCQFSYRNSVFKQHKHQYLITEVCFRLGDCNPLIHDYDSLANYLKVQGVERPDALQISRAVASIRASRLPDPEHLGNAGSFFHNPVVDNVKAERLREQFPRLPTYPNGPDHCKLSAAWLIDNAGLKGIRHGDVGVYEKQALVLVNHGDGDGSQLLVLAQEIQQRIKSLYAIDLQIEPTII